MDIMICENLKALRKSKGDTQEELADFLGISTQAVSKWERGEGYPDITFLPKIAIYFNVTVDDLLGVSEIRKQERKKQILDQHLKYANLGNVNAELELMRKAIKEFPNDYQIIFRLMFSLYNFVYCKPQYFDEIIKLGEKIISECTDDETRYEALQLLCLAYSGVGNYDKAKEYAQKFPKHGFTSNAVLNSILKGEELLVNSQKNIIDSVDDLFLNILGVTNAFFDIRGKDYPAEAKIHAYQTAIKIYELIFEDGNLGFFNGRLFFLYENIAFVYARLNHLELTLENLALAAKYAFNMDALKDQHKYTAPLLNGVVYNESDTAKGSMDTCSKQLFDVLSHECFNFCREDNRFKEIAESLSSHS